jgi:membrane fusion protein, copper/silver efflux system
MIGGNLIVTVCQVKSALHLMYIKNLDSWVLFAALLSSLLGGGCGNDKSAQPRAQARRGEAVAKYCCPMHPEHVSDYSADCPVCGMRLVLVKGPPHVLEAEGPLAGKAGVQGRKTVTVSPGQQQLIGLRTSRVEWKEIGDTVRATATVQPDERLQSIITARFSGWICSLKVNYTGQAVTNGQPLVTVYSPELLAAETDFHLAYVAFEKSTSISVEQRESVKRRMEVARRKLEVWQVGQEEIHALERGPPPDDELLLRSTASGDVVSKDAYAGRTFQAGDTFYEITDLSHVWLRAFVFEHELTGIEVGQKAWATFPYLGNRLCECSVTFIAPRIDPQTRRAEVRLELDNSDLDLRLESWANVEIEVALRKRLVVPSSAVIDTGTRFLAFLQQDNGNLEPRELTIGNSADDYREVLAGVREGDIVVENALFLIDSESQLKAAVAGMGANESLEDQGNQEKMTAKAANGRSEERTPAEPLVSSPTLWQR